MPETRRRKILIKNLDYSKKNSCYFSKCLTNFKSKHQDGVLIHGLFSKTSYPS